MADNVAITAGSGTSISTEEVTTLNGGAVSAQHIQRVIPATRTADGTAIDEAAGSGANSASTKRVTIATDDTVMGALNETAPATDTASSGLNGRLQRIAQRLTSLIALLPTSLGAKTAANSLAVTLATDDVLVAPIGIVTETAPATDTASSGLNGRLQRIAQRLTSIIALLPSSLGANGGLKIEGVASGTAVPISGNVTNAGTFAVQDATAQASLSVMDDWDNGASDGASVSGDVAHDSPDAGEPVKVGGKAVSAEPAAVTANDRVNAFFDLVGKQIVALSNPENMVSGAITTAMTGTTSTSLIAAPAAGLRNYITTIIVSNAHATVGTDIVIQDGSGGTTLMTIPAAAVYGGAVITLPVPLRQPTTATAIYCANVTTGASTKVSAVGYKGV